MREQLPFFSKIINKLLIALGLTIILFVSSVLLILLHPYYGYKTDFINPAAEQTNSYSDLENLGNSPIYHINQTEQMGFDCQLQAGADFPFCLYSLRLGKLNKGMDFSKVDHLRLWIDYQTPNNDVLRVTLEHFANSYSRLSNANSYKIHQKELTVDASDRPIIINMQDLIVPAWWLNTRIGRLASPKKELHNIIKLQLGTGNNATFGQYSLRLQRIDLVSVALPLQQIYQYILTFWAAYLPLLLIVLSNFLIKALFQQRQLEKISHSISQALTENIYH